MEGGSERKMRYEHQLRGKKVKERERWRLNGTVRKNGRGRSEVMWSNVWRFFACHCNRSLKLF